MFQHVKNFKMLSQGSTTLALWSQESAWSWVAPSAVSAGAASASAATCIAVTAGIS